MKLKSIHIENFRKLNNVDVTFGDATFLIGANNAGKTSTLDAIEYLISDKKLDDSCRSRYIEDDQEKMNNNDIIIEGLFSDVPGDIINQRGFNARRLSVEIVDGQDVYSFKYRVRFSSDKKTHREMQMHSLTLKPEYVNLQSYQDFINAGVDSTYFEGKDLNKKLTPKLITEMQDFCPIVFSVNEENEWFENPGGIPGNVLSQLPRYLKIKADVLSDEMAADKSGTLHDLLDILFSQVRDKSSNYKKAVEALADLEKEMDTSNPDTEFGKLMTELNSVVDNVFHKATINVNTELTKPENLKAKFSATLKSNVETPIEYQGTGLIRATVFALLQYNKQREERRPNENNRGIFIAFEEPELFLHPNAAEKMRDVIYDLASGSCQIVATTHSPYMINIEKRPKQVLNSYKMGEYDYSVITPFNISQAFKDIEEDDRVRVKMIQKIDDYVARVFFAQKVIIVEGDTEDIVFKHTINVMPEEVRKEIKGKYQIIKATGKATMISFIKYLKAMNVDLFVVHDADSETPGAAIMNEPILKALGNNEGDRFMMHNCIEEQLGYPAPSTDKPYHAYLKVLEWQTWNDVPTQWKDDIRRIFSEYSHLL